MCDIPSHFLTSFRPRDVLPFFPYLDLYIWTGDSYTIFTDSLWPLYVRILSNFNCRSLVNSFSLESRDNVELTIVIRNWNIFTVFDL